MKKIKKIFKILIVLIIVGMLFIFIINEHVNSKGEGLIFRNIDQVPESKVALILGAKVNGDRLSDMLSDRTKTALELYQQGKVKKILVSGDHGRKEYDEVNAVKNFLLEEKVKPEDIFLDHAGFDTYDSLYRAKEVFQVDSVVVVTQEFHLPRAMYIAKSLGIKQVSGLIADKQTYINASYQARRELLAKTKAFLNIIFNSKPQFLGDITPIDGDGQKSWD